MSGQMSLTLLPPTPHAAPSCVCHPQLLCHGPGRPARGPRSWRAAAKPGSGGRQSLSPHGARSPGDCRVLAPRLLPAPLRSLAEPNAGHALEEGPPAGMPQTARGGERAEVVPPVGGGVGGQEEEEEEEEEEERPDLTGITEWELDFCSRPIMDERGKRVWELLVCDASRRLQYAEYFPSNKINSGTLKDALQRIMAVLGAPKPQKIRFFRGQMQTIISKACAELDIRPVPSQRCVTLVQWLEERYDTVYGQHPGFQPGAAPLLQLEEPSPKDLPDALRGDKWAFVQLPLSEVVKEMERVESREIFGEVFGRDVLNLEGVDPGTMVPGVAVASARAMPLAAWTNALELAAIRVDAEKACLVLSTGVADRWRYAFYRRSKQAAQEAASWEDAKLSCGGLHFVAVQEDLEADDCVGFWLLRDAPASKI